MIRWSLQSDLFTLHTLLVRLVRGNYSAFRHEGGFIAAIPIHAVSALDCIYGCLWRTIDSHIPVVPKVGLGVDMLFTCHTISVQLIFE
jgi:hypothetical protein